MKIPRLLVLTDRAQLPPGRSLTETVADCVRAGATHVVMRELDLSREERAALAASLARIRGLVLITARDRFRESFGVHLAAAQDGAAPVSFHGRSCHTEADVRRAVVAAAAYVTVSPVAPTESKPGYGPPLGTYGVGRLVAASNGTPVFALGGVVAGNARSFLDAGAHGVAVMGTLMRADDPATTTAELLAEVNR